MKIDVVKFKQVAVVIGMTLSGIGGSGAMTPVNALTFNFIPAAGMSAQAQAGFAAAGAMWSSLFTDNVTINLNIDFASLGAGVLGQASTTDQLFNYNTVYNALNNDKTSADDISAVNSLSSGSNVNLLINHTINNGNSATPYLDNTGANTNTIRMTNANAKALGLATTGTSDASISFSSNFTWDFDRSDGISGGAYDFVGIAAHEIGHALGFISGVDEVDSYNGSRFDNQLTYVNPLDLFRYSADSKSKSAIDFTADTRDKYFSLDGGTTKIASFSTGVTFGDGRQASHWKDNLGLGIMDPTAASGELLTISENDQRAFDAIGWNRAVSASATAVPEPANLIGTFICAAFGVKLVLKRRQKRFDSIEKATVAET